MTTFARSKLAVLFALAIAFGIQSHTVLAEEAPKNEPLDEASQSRPLWEAGLAGLVIKQLAYPGSSVQTDNLLLLPYGIYRGPVVRAEREGFSVRTIRNPRYEINLGVAAAFGTDTADISVREGMPDLGFLAEVGPMLIVRLGRIDSLPSTSKHNWSLQLPVRTVWDFTHLRYRGISFEPRVVYRSNLAGKLDFLATAGVLLGTRRLSEHFYSVDDKFANDDRAAYEASSGLISSRINLTLGYRVRPDLRLVTFWRGESISGAQNEDSPLADATNGWTAGVGFSWQVFKSLDAGSE
ncbi:MipA/OmpV family protein [Granulosicoccus antarcticus]|uniref:Outer membrane protein OmpV n=1 Tax=Granulosicoccus antarcticus IMCC3135 TaxID=1192854 RepID=A0A2Z2NWQ8_9GAMM|nr:MipA/OmpV family protein [Granulosicoccus antarcticus]ASJ73280.1 hypothetical protein IMCC3135_15990 [Granulosicoccus antarcticus IMCC3135]